MGNYDQDYKRKLTATQLSYLVFVLKTHLSQVVFASNYAQRMVRNDLEEMKQDIEFILKEIDKNESR